MNLNSNRLTGPKAPKIVYNYVFLFEFIGSDIVLPCKTIGRPRPEVFWFDDDDNIINGQDPRLSVLNNGDLVITGLRWADMGGYTCVAKNHIGKDSVTVFLYPVRVSILSSSMLQKHNNNPFIPLIQF